MAINDPKAADAKAAIKMGRFDKFHLDERPERRPRQNPYFEDIKNQLALHRKGAENEGSSNESQESKDHLSGLTQNEEPLLVGKELTLEDENRTKSVKLKDTSSHKTPVIALKPDPSASSRSISNVTLAKGSKKSEGSATASPTPRFSTPVPLSFDDFNRHWSPFLKSKQITLCKVIFNHTIAIGRSEFVTTTEELSKESGVSFAHIIYLLRQLEKLGFVTRDEVKSEKNQSLGKKISFQPFPPRR